jgi:8-oxo-dGTP diphosphatase
VTLAGGPLGRPVVDAAELAAIRARYGRGERRVVRLALGEDRFGRQDARRLFGAAADRRGEVALVAIRPDGSVLLHTKAFYPEGAFRLPTGGIHPGETVLDAVAREALEETGLPLPVEAFIGLLRYEIADGPDVLPFATWLFRLAAPDADLCPQDVSEQITDLRWVAPAELPRVARALRALPPAWAAWGAFRAPAHVLAARALIGRGR